MTVATYHAVAANRELLAEARRVLDAHITSSATGRCLVCGTLGPCYKRENAVAIFSRALRLPPRQPVAARPEPSPPTGGLTHGNWWTAHLEAGP